MASKSGCFSFCRSGWLIQSLVVFFCFGCAGSGQRQARGAEGEKRSTEVVHEKCDLDAATTERVDVNQDRRPDIWVAKESGRELCRAVDLNFDGKIDSYTYHDTAGVLRRRETDYDRDGQVDEIVIFKGGVIADRTRVTVSPGRIDTWDYYKNGQLLRSERDSTGDGVVDQWWEYTRPGCPLIHTDANHDGRPDPGTTVDYCKETGYSPPERNEGTVQSPNFQRPGALPTEVENKAAPNAEGGAATPASAPTAATPAASTAPAANTPAPAKAEPKKGGK